MTYQIRTAVLEDLPRIQDIYAYARKFMAETGNPNQWGTTHPPVETLREDIRQGQLYVATAGDTIHGVFMFFLGEDPTYRQIFEGSWLSDAPYGTIHRIASDGSGGIFGACLDHCLQITRHLRIDTHHDNVVMQNLVKKLGFKHCGTIYVEEDDYPRLAFEKTCGAAFMK